MAASWGQKLTKDDILFLFGQEKLYFYQGKVMEFRRVMYVTTMISLVCAFVSATEL